MFMKYPNWVVALIKTFVEKRVKFDIKYDINCEANLLQAFPGNFPSVSATLCRKFFR